MMIMMSHVLLYGLQIKEDNPNKQQPVSIPSNIKKQHENRLHLLFVQFNTKTCF